MDNDKIIAQKLSHLMKTRGVSRSELAEILDVPYTTLTNWIVGTRKPKYGSLMQLADFFGISVQEFLGEEEIEKSDDYIIRLNGQEFVFEPKRLGRQEQEMLIDYYNFLLAKSENK